MTEEMMSAGALCAAAAVLATLTVVFSARRRRMRSRIPPNYTARYLERNRFRRRHVVYVSRQTHDTVTELVRRLSDAGADITTGGFIDNVMRDHLSRHRRIFERLPKSAAPHNGQQ